MKIVVTGFEDYGFGKNPTKRELVIKTGLEAVWRIASYIKVPAEVVALPI